MDTVVTFRNEALLGTDLVTDVSRLLVDAGSSINDVRELVIADAGIEDVDLLLGQLEPGTDLWRVDSQADMASMFSAALSGAYTRLHVLGHGQPGSVTLGGRALQVEDFTALSRGNVVVQSMHFWSCMTGAGIKGRAFVDGIAKALGVVVTAFSALVGAERNGGGWSPDILSRYGEITSVPFINATAYPHTLPSSALQVKSVVTSTGVDVQVWLTAGTSINNATLSLNYDPAKVNPVLVSNQVAYTSGVAGWSWLSSQTSPTCLEIGSYGSVNAISSSSDILLNSVSFTLVQGSSGFSISLAGSYLEDADGTIALGTLPSLTYIALAAPVWDAFTPPENLSYIAGATASLDFAVKATDANGDTITYKAVVGQMSNVATFEPTAVLAEISLTASNGHLTGSAVFLQTTTAGNYVLRLYADDNTADAISGTPLDVPFVLSAPLDTLVPTVAITSSASALKAGETAKITFTFSEDPGESFDAGDITTTGGTLGTLSGTGLVRTATFTPTASLNSGNASITVGAGSYTDTAGNPGIAGKIAAAITVDTTTPSSQTYGITAHTKYWNS
ncbi:MAG: Ig-like domain-containing protein, partial [Chlorobium sp.]